MDTKQQADFARRNVHEKSEKQIGKLICSMHLVQVADGSSASFGSAKVGSDLNKKHRPSHRKWRVRS